MAARARSITFRQLQPPSNLNLHVASILAASRASSPAVASQTSRRTLLNTSIVTLTSATQSSLKVVQMLPANSFLDGPMALDRFRASRGPLFSMPFVRPQFRRPMGVGEVSAVIGSRPRSSVHQSSHPNMFPSSFIVCIQLKRCRIVHQ